VPDPQTGIAVAAAAIAASFPSISTARLTHLGSGWDFDAFLTADGWVFRFPLRADCVTTLDTERRVHALLTDLLPASVAVPRVELVAEPNAVFPLRFDGHRYLPGVHADAIPANLLPATARSIGEALGAIHTVPEAAARAAGVRPFDETSTGWLEWLEQRIASVTEVRGMNPGVDDAIDWVRSQSAVDASPVTTRTDTVEANSPNRMVRLLLIGERRDNADDDPAVDERSRVGADLRLYRG